MCGISAVFKRTMIADSDLSKLNRMNAEMVYRGPDDNGVWHDEKCALAHTRLSIIGLDDGHQPIFNEDESLVLVCNGEIYNYVSLKSKLISAGHKFRTKSDSEVILHLYEDYGTDCLSYLQGMFAICLWDKNKKQLFIARDRIGEKFLYYAELSDGVVFSTELKTISKYYIDKPQLDYFNLAQIIRFNYPLELRNTYISQIKRLQAGEYALVSDEGLSLHKYWDRYCQPKFEGSKQEAHKQCLNLMRESVYGCLQSDVPVAVLLSGGVDSSAIAALAKESGKEIHCITAGYKGNFKEDERHIAKNFAKQKGLIYHEVELDLTNFRDLFLEYSKYLDEPVADISSIAQWALYKKAKELGFTVLLGGLGGDELFYGYPPHNLCAQKLQLIRDLTFRGSLKSLFDNIHSLITKFNPRILIPSDRWPTHWTYNFYKEFSKTACICVEDEKIDFSQYNVNYKYPADANIDFIYNLLFSTFMTSNCLYLSDREGMGNSLEIRSPLVDYKLVEFVSSLPTDMKYELGKPKQFMKYVLNGIVPDNILYASKKGFTPPYSFIDTLNREYKYQVIKSDYTFYNSMLADVVLKNVLFS